MNQWMWKFLLLAIVVLGANRGFAAGYYTNYKPNKCEISSAKGFSLTIERRGLESEDTAFYNGTKEFKGSIYSVSLEFSKTQIVARIFNDRKMIGLLNLDTNADLHKGDTFGYQIFTSDSNVGLIRVDCTVPRE